MNNNCFGVMIDCSRNGVMKIERLKIMADYLSRMGYNSMLLYTEDTYEVNREPYFGYLRGRYTKDEIKELDAYCTKIGIELIPCIQTLAHLLQIFRWAEYEPINDCMDILLAEDERTYALIENMFETVEECYTSRRVNIGMDEAHFVGLGKYAMVNGSRNRYDILRKHIEKVMEIAKKHGFSTMMWSDMYIRLGNNGDYNCNGFDVTDEMIKSIPPKMDLIYWDYWDTEERVYKYVIGQHRKMAGERVWYAGGAWTWGGFTPRNGFSLIAMLSAMRACRECGVDNIFITMWGDDGNECSPFAMLPSLYKIKKSYDGVTDESEIKSGFKELTGYDFDDFMLLDAPDDIFGGEGKQKTPSKYLLFNDPLLGKFDTTVREGTNEEYRKIAEKLQNKAVGEFAHIYESEAALCRALAIKSELGVKIRSAYKSGNKDEIHSAIESVKKCRDAVDEFYKAFRKAWFVDRKPHGFDVQDIRLGGLIRRLESTAERLDDYASGRVSEIPELEEELLDYYCGKNPDPKETTWYNGYKFIATQNVL